MLTSSSIGRARISDCPGLVQVIERVAQQLFLRPTGSARRLEQDGPVRRLERGQEHRDFGKLTPEHPPVFRVGPELRFEHGQFVTQRRVISHAHAGAVRVARQIPVSDVTELASGPITASDDGITAQLIRSTARTSVIMIVWPSCGKQVLDFGGRVSCSYSVAAPNTRQERRS
jgi:hypothetical protein